MIKNYVLFGGSGFLGTNFQYLLGSKKIEFKNIGSKEINLLDENNKEIIRENTKHKNTIYIFFSALTPDKGKDFLTFEKNIKMAKNFLENFNYEDIDTKKIIYISSDAVYPLSEENINIDSLPMPTDLYSSMHLTREIMFKEKFNNLMILRPTLIYGYGDTHNSYGPNRFFSQMISEKKIKIFGKGQDLRDHLYIDDFCELLLKFSFLEKFGTYILASGNSISYLDLSNIFLKNFSNNLQEIIKIPVDNKPTRRCFDMSYLKNFFEFKFSSLENNIIKYYKKLVTN